MKYKCEMDKINDTYVLIREHLLKLCLLADIVEDVSWQFTEVSALQAEFDEAAQNDDEKEHLAYALENSDEHFCVGVVFWLELHLNK